jgi:hypothetical protein
MTSLTLNSSGLDSWSPSEVLAEHTESPEKTIKKNVKKTVFDTKKGFFIVGRTEAFNWTAKLSIIPSEKKPFAQILPLNRF